MEIISSRPITQDSRPSGPMILVDGAHNLPGVESLIENLKLFNYSNLILVFGVMKDKNWKGMILKLSKRANKIILNKTTSQGERVLEPKIIEEFLKKNNFKGEIKIIEDVGGSLKYAKSIATKKDLVLVCGSIYMISESL
jgi:dihydrofolate synthase/folylpolyglutamate synthase